MPIPNQHPPTGPGEIMNGAQRAAVARLAESKGFPVFGAHVAAEAIPFREAMRRLEILERAARDYAAAASKHGLDLPVSKALQHALAEGNVDKAIGVAMADVLAALDDRTAIQTRHQPTTVPIGKGTY